MAHLTLNGSFVALGVGALSTASLAWALVVYLLWRILRHWNDRDIRLRVAFALNACPACWGSGTDGTVGCADWAIPGEGLCATCEGTGTRTGAVHAAAQG